MGYSFPVGTRVELLSGEPYGWGSFQPKDVYGVVQKDGGLFLYYKGTKKRAYIFDDKGLTASCFSEYNLRVMEKRTLFQTIKQYLTSIF